VIAHIFFQKFPELQTAKVLRIYDAGRQSLANAAPAQPGSSLLSVALFQVRFLPDRGRNADITKGPDRAKTRHFERLVTVPDSRPDASLRPTGVSADPNRRRQQGTSSWSQGSPLSVI
jgi:hypothetical protein